jgi:hypothetical protein
MQEMKKPLWRVLSGQEWLGCQLKAGILPLALQNRELSKTPHIAKVCLLNKRLNFRFVRSDIPENILHNANKVWANAVHFPAPTDERLKRETKPASWPTCKRNK